jgi:hypothetical protein
VQATTLPFLSCLPRCQAMAPSYTTFHICKYSGAARQRILDATAGNYLSGFWGWQGPCPGVAFHNGWMGNVGNVCLPPNSWVLSSDQIRLYRAQRGAVHHTTGSGGLGSAAKWSINAGAYTTAEYSDWACAALLHYSRELSLAEVRQVEDWLDGLYAVAPGWQRAGTAWQKVFRWLPKRSCQLVLPHFHITAGF